MQTNKPNISLIKYAGLAFQFFIGLSLFLFLGMKLDQYFFKHTSLAIWILPLIFIIAVIIKIIKDTSTKK